VDESGLNGSGMMKIHATGKIRDSQDFTSLALKRQETGKSLSKFATFTQIDVSLLVDTEHGG